MLDHALQRLPREVQTVEGGIFVLEARQHAQRLRVVIKPAIRGHHRVQRAFSGVSERRMANIVGQSQGFGEILVQAERAGGRAGDLGDLKGMRKTGPVMIALMGDEDLGLLLEATEGVRVNNPVPVALKIRPGTAWRLGMEPPPGRVRVAGVGRPARGLMTIAHDQPSLHRNDPLSQVCISSSCTVVTMSPHSTPTDGTDGAVRLSERAARRIGRICSGQPEGTLLRLEVIGGGCSGFSYRFGLAPGPNSDDVLIERDGARLAVDEASLPFLAGSEVDFTEELIGSSFQVRNPNAKSGCGCGTSFSI